MNNCINNHPADNSFVYKCVGYAYVPWQVLGETFTPEKGLGCGTVFPELSLTIDEYGYICKAGGMFYADE